jgi:hypothetical protein
VKKLGLIIILSAFQFCAVAQNWESVGTKKFNHSVDQLFSDTVTGQLYNTGWYWMLDTASAYGLSAWDGTEWQAALTNCGVGTQKRLCRFQGELYISKSPYLFKWNGTSWDTAANAVAISGFYNDGDSVLYIMGGFNSVNSIPASKIARFDGVNWSAIDSTIWTGSAICAFRYQGQMYFGGGFFNTSNNIWRIARWDGTNWYAVGGGVTGSISGVGCMEEYNGELYVGGYMEVAMGNPGDFIARWNGSSWTQVGGGMYGGQVFNMKVFNNELWAVGQFGYAGGVSATFVARYDGLDWCSVGVFDNAIGAIEVHNNELYIGGNFWTVDGDSVNKVVKWIGGNSSDSCGHLNTEVGEIEQGLPVKVFPNPVNDVATFQFANSDGSRTIIIYDEIGREIWRRETSELSVEFPASYFSSGLYFYTIIEREDSTTTGKFLIER